MYELMDQLSGGNPEYGFAWDGTDDANDPMISMLLKIFKSVGRSVPENLKDLKWDGYLWH